MTKMIPWKVSGVGEASRNAARAAARHHGTSVGDWLDGLIAERAGETGLEDSEMDEQDVIRRGPARRGAAWSDGIARRAAELDAEDEPLRPRFIRSGNEDDIGPDRTPRRDTSSSRSEPVADEDAIHLLAEAAGEMERRAGRAKRPAGPVEDRLGRLEARLGEMAGHMERVLVEIQSQRQGQTRAGESGEVTELERKLRRAEDALNEARYASRAAPEAGFGTPDHALQDLAAALQARSPRAGDRTGAALKNIHDVLEVIAGELFDGYDRPRRWAGRR